SHSGHESLASLVRVVGALPLCLHCFETLADLGGLRPRTMVLHGRGLLHCTGEGVEALRNLVAGAPQPRRPLVGMNWQGANRIVDGLRANQDRLLDIFTSAGQRALDALVQDVVRQQQADRYPFGILERFAARELANRAYTEGDVDRLVEAIRR